MAGLCQLEPAGNLLPVRMRDEMLGCTLSYQRYVLNCAVIASGVCWGM